MSNLDSVMGKRWTSEEVARLKTLRESLTYGQIAPYMDRSVSSLKCAVRRHGNGFSAKLGGRPSGSYEAMCRKGLHALADGNLYVRVRNGRVERQCKACQMAARKR